MTSASRQTNVCISKKPYICIAVVLIGIILTACVELVFVSTGILKPESGDHVFFAVTAIATAVLSLVALGLTVFLIKTASEPTEEIHALLKRFNGNSGLAHHIGNGDGEAVLALEGMMNELCGLLQSVQIRLRAINGSAEVLIRGIHQVAADQVNLFSLNAEIESARAHRDGFSVITDEILSLAERTGHLTSEIRDAASQLRAMLNEAIAELDDVVRRVDLNHASVPGGVALPR
jgi:methyl-accepting chemotaxis protein